jgi:hypothetical protein
VTCGHPNPECINHYEIVRKYRCDDCGGLFICSCERDFALRHLAHQVRFGRVLETQERVPVNGFADRMCAECRGLPEQPHPKAAIYGLKGKVERFYWREIIKTQFELTAERYGRSIPPSPLEARKIRREALEKWKQVHRKTPKYDMTEQTEASFLREVVIPTRDLLGDYLTVEKDGQRLGKWKTSDGKLMSPEELVAMDAESQGYVVLRCERALISCLTATFLGQTIQDPYDPEVRPTYRGSTVGWTSSNRSTATIEIPLPTDFGTPGYSLRRGDQIQRELAALASGPSLLHAFDERLPFTISLRDYLWVAQPEVVDRTRVALRHLPLRVVLDSLAWVIGHLWARITGWPDLLLLSGDSYRFSEVKSPHDELSAEQMQWFRWARGSAEISCEIVRVRKQSRRFG